MGFLLRAHRHGFPGLHVVQPCLLRDGPSGFEHSGLPRDLECERPLDEAERVHVLDFDLRAELLPAARTNGHVHVATELSLLHVAVRHADELHDLLELGQVSNRFLGATDIGLADDLRERNTGAVEVDIAVAIRIPEAVVDGLSGVFFEVQPGDADAFRPSVDVDLQPTVLGERLIELRDLVTLRQVGIEVVLAREAGEVAHLAVEGQRGFDTQDDGLAIQDRQRAGQTQGYGIGLRVRRVAEGGRRAAEELGFRTQLYVDLESDDRLVASLHFSPPDGRNTRKKAVIRVS